MKSLLAATFTLLLAAALQAASPMAGENQAKTDAKLQQPNDAAPSTPGIAKSVFETSTLFKDPFHPGSIRRVKVVPGKTNDTPPPDIQMAKYLVLNGLSGSTNERLAIINGRTLAAGEEAEVTTEQGKVKIRCLEIRGNAVMVTVGTDGTRSELRLKE